MIAMDGRRSLDLSAGIGDGAIQKAEESLPYIIFKDYLERCEWTVNAVPHFVVLDHFSLRPIYGYWKIIKRAIAFYQKK